MIRTVYKKRGGTCPLGKRERKDNRVLCKSVAAHFLRQDGTMSCVIAHRQPEMAFEFTQGIGAFHHHKRMAKGSSWATSIIDVIGLIHIAIHMIVTKHIDPCTLV